jgi:glycosyltransferase involved in cell wall biosynthesis
MERNMKTKKPIALVYGHPNIGEYDLRSDVYYWEGLQDMVNVYSFSSVTDFETHYSRIEPDVVICIGINLKSSLESVNKRIIHLDEIPEDNVLANIIVAQTVFKNSSNIRPKFSVFTPTYKTGERILRAYEGLVNQTYQDWEWVLVDDSPDDDTWIILDALAKSDFRVKPHKITPITGGNVGLAKNRACSLSDGQWLVEMDHDDYLLPTCLEDLDKASNMFPDAGFMYSELCELYEDGEMKYYGKIWGEEGYGHPDNTFGMGYSVHYWTEHNGKKYLAHRYPDINPYSIRFNFSMPNHVRVWRKDIYQKVGGHNKRLPVADDFELIVKTFLETRIIHVKKMLYLQYNNHDSTVDNNVRDINRRARLIKDHFDLKIHNRIIELGKHDWFWNPSQGRSYIEPVERKFYEGEQVMNYIYL